MTEVNIKITCSEMYAQIVRCTNFPSWLSIFYWSNGLRKNRMYVIAYIPVIPFSDWFLRSSINFGIKIEHLTGWTNRSENDFWTNFRPYWNSHTVKSILRNMILLHTSGIRTAVLLRRADQQVTSNLLYILIKQRRISTGKNKY